MGLANKVSDVLSEESQLTCMRYIELNPVRAGMVETTCEYRRSSYVQNTSGAVDGSLTSHQAYWALGARRRISLSHTA